MRQVLTWRFLAALVALGALAILVDRTLASVDKTGSIATVASADFDENGELIPRRIDLVENVAFVVPTDDFGVAAGGLTTGQVDLVLDAERTARVVPGTPGEVSCENFEDANRCALAADLLGDAVVWFALLPKGPNETVELPPIEDLQDGYALFVNGWELPYAPVIERDEDTCGDDVVSFGDFLERFGPGSTTVVDLEQGIVTSVICGEEFVPPPSTVVFDGSLDASIVVPSSDGPSLADPDVEAPDE